MKLKNILPCIVLVFASVCVWAQEPSEELKSEAPCTPSQAHTKRGHFRDANFVSHNKRRHKKSCRSSSPIIKESMSELIINGKPASELTDDEKKKFLQDKITTLNQKPLEVQLIHVACGYPLTLVFPEPIKSVYVGNPGAIRAEVRSDRDVILSACGYPGDSFVQVIFQNDKRFVYHVTIDENLLNANIVLFVNSNPF